MQKTIGGNIAIERAVITLICTQHICNLASGFLDNNFDRGSIPGVGVFIDLTDKFSTGNQQRGVVAAVETGGIAAELDQFVPKWG